MPLAAAADDIRAYARAPAFALPSLSPNGALMMHGRYDAVVPFSQSRRFARALRQSDKEHRFVERSDCDHEMTIESCRIAFFENLARFLDDHLQ